MGRACGVGKQIASVFAVILSDEPCETVG